MIKATSAFIKRFVGNSKIQKTCDNCYEKAALAEMSNGTVSCEPCSKDIEMLTNRLPRRD